MRSTENDRRKLNRIKEISIQIKELSAELFVLSGGSADPEMIMDVVKVVFGADPKVKGKKTEQSLAKFAAIYLMKQFTNYGDKDFVCYMQVKEHSSIQHRFKQAKNLMDVDEQFQKKIADCKRKISYLI